jgi:hypothetical protein
MTCLIGSPFMMINPCQIRKHSLPDTKHFEQGVIRISQVTQQPRRRVATADNGLMKTLLSDCVQYMLHSAIVGVPLKQADSYRSHGFSFMSLSIIKMFYFALRY